MTLERIAGVCVAIGIGSAAAAAQQSGTSTGQTPQPQSIRVIERTYSSSGLAPSRLVEIRSTSDHGKLVTRTLELLGTDGGLEPWQEVTTETVRTGPNSASTREDVFRLGPQRDRVLLRRTQSEQETSTDGNNRSVHNTWLTDLDGGLGLASRQIEETRSIAPGVRSSTNTLLLPGMNEPLRESERTEDIERRTGPAVVRRDSAHLVRDLNGRWQAAETRSQELRQTETSESLDETIHSPDLTGTLVVSRRSITRRSDVNGRDDVVTETYARNAEGYVRSDSRMGLGSRIRTSTTDTGDGGHRTVEEVEARNPVSPGEPLRLTRRTVTTVRRIGPNRWATERQVFALDLNGRMAPVMTEIEETVEK